MADNTYSRWAFLYNDWPVRDEPAPRQNVDSLIAKLTYWLGATGCDHVSGLRFITRSHDSLDEVETMGDCLAHLQEMRAELAALRSENEALRRERDEARMQRDYWRGRDKAGAEIEVELTIRATAAESTVEALRKALEEAKKRDIDQVFLDWLNGDKEEIVLTALSGVLPKLHPITAGAAVIEVMRAMIKLCPQASCALSNHRSSK